MPFNINRFKYNLEAYGHLRNNMFEVYVQPPPMFQGATINNDSGSKLASSIDGLLKYRTEQVRVPGIQLLTAEVPRYGVGPTMKMPFSSQLQETHLSIMMDKMCDIYQFWYHWVRGIHEFSGTSGNDSGIGPANGVPTYRVEYKKNYSSTIQIVIYNQEGEVAQVINLLEAFPTSIRELPLAWSDNQTVMRMSVAIAYSEYNVENTAVGYNHLLQSDELSGPGGISIGISLPGVAITL